MTLLHCTRVDEHRHRHRRDLRLLSLMLVAVLLHTLNTAVLPHCLMIQTSATISHIPHNTSCVPDLTTSSLSLCRALLCFMQARVTVVEFLKAKGLFRGTEDNPMRLGLCSRCVCFKAKPTFFNNLHFFEVFRRSDACFLAREALPCSLPAVAHPALPGPNLRVELLRCEPCLLLLLCGYSPFVRNATCDTTSCVMLSLDMCAGPKTSLSPC